MNNEQLDKIMECTNFTLKDLLGASYGLYKHDPGTADSPILFYFDATNGNLTCLVRKSETEIYSLFTNDRNDPRHKDFQVFMKFIPSEEDKKVVSKLVDGMPPNTVKRANLDKIREEVRRESDSQLEQANESKENEQ